MRASLVRRLKASSILIVSLLLFSAGCVAYGLSSSVRGFDLGLALTVAELACLIGWWFGGLQLKTGYAVTSLILIGWTGLFLRLGGLVRPLIFWLWSLADLAVRTAYPINLAPIDTGISQAAWSALSADVMVVAGRTGHWLAGIIAGRLTYDPLAIALIWSVLLWPVCAWMGWAMRRGKAASLALAPSLVLLAGILGFLRQNLNGLLPFIGASLLLIILSGQVNRERGWEQSRIDYSTELRFDLAFYALPLALIIFTASLLASSISIQKIIDSFQRMVTDTSGRGQSVARSLGLEPKPIQSNPFAPYTWPNLPQVHLIGSGPELSREVAFYVSISDPASTAGSAQTAPQRPYYWQGMTFDIYTGSGWTTTQYQINQYSAGERASLTDLAGQRVIDAQINLVLDQGGILYAPGLVASVDHAYSIAWRRPGDVFAASVSAPTYKTQALIPAFDADQLRQAGSDYPDWVIQRYLQLPEDVPNRVLALARELTATQATPYDQAKAIEAYLRTIPYTLDLPAPPGNQDVADYFLFRLRKGYCDYFATAMVVLAREAGIPARLATGYASGAYDAGNARYVVTQADAHSWAEVYFPGYGWVPFEPTSSRPELTWLGQPAGSELSLPPSIPPQTDFGEQVWTGSSAVRALRTVSILLPGAAALLVAIVLLIPRIETRRLEKLPPQDSLRRLYRHLGRYRTVFHIETLPGDTPYELAERICGRIQQLSLSLRWGRLGQPDTLAIHRLTTLYVQSMYAPAPPGPEAVRSICRDWLRLRPRLLWYSLRARLARGK